MCTVVVVGSSKPGSFSVATIDVSFFSDLLQKRSPGYMFLYVLVYDHVVLATFFPSFPTTELTSAIVFYSSSLFFPERVMIFS